MIVPTHSKSRRLFFGISIPIFLFFHIAVAAAPSDVDIKPEVDLSISRGLQFLARQQQRDGSFEGGGPKVAMTGLALMSFLANGHTPDQGRYGLVVRSALDYLVKAAPADGYFGKLDGSRMYGHGIATLALAEACGVDTDPAKRKLEKAALQRAVDVILKAQDAAKPEVFAGGWRYEPASGDSDLSLSGWNALALRASENVGIVIAPDRVKRAVQFVLHCYHKDIKGFSYQPGGAPTAAMTGVALLNLYLLDGADRPELAAAAKFLAEHPVDDATQLPFYALYYTTQAAFQAGDPSWTAVWKVTQTRVLPLQNKDDGGWPQSVSGQEPGRVYSTSMALLTLSVPYRLLPRHRLLYTVPTRMPPEPSQNPVSGTGTNRPSGQREQFSAEELTIIMSHFDIGIIDSIVEYPRGSRKAPKLLVVSEQGKFLLKRRARGKDDPFKVAFTHALQLYLAGKQFPLPHLIGTKRDNNSMLQWRNGVYELFEYIPGQGYPQTLESTFDSGRVLALYHKLLEDFKSEWQPPSGSYHMASPVDAGLKSIAAGVPIGPNRENSDVHELLTYLQSSYRKAADQVQAIGIDTWPRQIVHADWHPGNMLYRDNHVVAVIDYDSARLLARVIDIANGALQFSIIGGDDDVSKWPDYVDESRFKRFLRGYDEVMLLSQAEIRTLPLLMIEALIAEAVFPIAATGSFGKVEGMPFLQMVQRKITWLQRHYERLIELAEG